ncbi:MAG: HAD family hydrolase [Pseudomonadota bacterium]
MHKRPRILTLDLDDTLWDVAEVIGRAEKKLAQWFREHHPEFANSYNANDVQRIRRQVIADCADRAHDLRFLRQTVYERLASRISYSTNFIDDATTEFDRWRNTVTLFDDARPALERLALKFPLYALTNGNADINAIGIGEYFEGSISSVLAGAAKPDPKIFQYALEMTGAKAADVIHIGDDPELDIEGAAKAGFRSAWIDRKAESWPEALAKPDFRATDMSDFADQLLAVVPS